MRYAVTFVNPDGNETRSRCFTGLRAAKRWAKWLAAQPFARNARVMQGGVGGREVYRVA